jgi:hypothetical protein
MLMSTNTISEVFAILRIDGVAVMTDIGANTIKILGQLHIARRQAGPGRNACSSLPRWTRAGSNCGSRLHASVMKASASDERFSP